MSLHSPRGLAAELATAGMKGVAWIVATLIVMGSLACGGGGKALNPQDSGTGGSAGTDGAVADGANDAAADLGSGDYGPVCVPGPLDGGDDGPSSAADAADADAPSAMDASDEAEAMDAGGGSVTLPSGQCVPGAFSHDGVCVCQPDTPTVCDLACTDLTTDAANCGTCGHACAPTAACNGGQCGPSVTNVVPAAPGCVAINIAVGNGALYWTDQGHGTVKTQSAACGQTTISSTETRPGFITVSGSNLFWIDVVAAQTSVNTVNQFPVTTTTTTATLRKASLLGGRPTDLVTETNLNGGILGIVVSHDGKTVYYSSDTKVKSIAIDAAAGTAGTVVGSEERGGIPTALALSADGSTLAYITELNGDVDVITVNNADGMPASCGKHDPADPSGQALLMVHCTRVARERPRPFFGGLVLNGTNAYWSNGGDIQVNAATPGAVQCNQTIAGAGGCAPITALAGNANDIYFGEDGLVEKTPYVVGSTAIVIARGQKAPNSMAVDATRVYWSTGDCEINATGL